MAIVTLSPFAGAGAQFFDNNGVPLSGGLLYTYAASSSTPLATYTTPVGTVANSNPIVLNASGRTTQETWLISGQSYKFVLNDVNGNLIGTYDNIPGLPQPIISNDASSIVYEQGTNTTAGSFTIGQSYLITSIGTTNFVAIGASANTTGIYFTATGVGSGTGTAQVSVNLASRLNQSLSVKDFGATGNGTTDDTSFFQTAITVASGRTLIIPNGTYVLSSANLDFGTVELQFEEGALLNVGSSIQLIIREQVIAGNYKIFSTTGNIIVANIVNPMWWGAVTSISSPGATVASANTLAFRKAAKSFYSDYSAITGTIASPSGPQTAFSLAIPAGIFYLSNGFTAAVGVTVSGQGANTLLCRLTANADTDTAIPLLTIGQTLGPAPTLAYQNDPGGQNISVFNSAGFQETSAQAWNLYFVDQNPNVAAFKPDYPGVQFHDLFFTSCGISIDFTGCADVTGNNIICDQGLTHFLFSGCQNINLTNVDLYNSHASSLTFLTNVRDVSINNFIIEYPQIMGIYFQETFSNIDGLRFSDGDFIMNAQYTSFVGMVRNRATNVNAFFYNCHFRNIYGPAIVNDLVTSGCRFAFQNCYFNGLATTSAYTQGSTMSLCSLLSGTYTFTNCNVQYMFNPASITYGPVTLNVNGLIYSNMSYTGGTFGIFNFAGGNNINANFIGVVGDYVTPLIYGNGALVNVISSINWLGAPYTDGSYVSWNVPANYTGDQYMVTLTANDGTPLAIQSRKTTTWIVEKSTEFPTSSTGYDTMSQVVLYQSPTVNSIAPPAANFVFSNNATTQTPAYPANTYFKIQVSPNYLYMKLNVNFLS